MNGYQYIQEFFKAILLQSVQIQGRLIVIPKSGSEFNTDDFDRVLIEVTKGQKYPLCAMLPPRSSGVFGKNDEWEDYSFELYFLNTTYYNDAGQVKKKNTGTGTSSKPVIEEWDEMKVSATDFLRVLQLVQKGNNSTSVVMLNNMFRLSQGKKFIDPVSFISNTRLSGVRLKFEAAIWTTCAIQDYVEGGVVILPDVDESTFEVELAVVRNEVLNIIEELGLEGIPGPQGPEGPQGPPGEGGSGGGISELVVNEVPAGAINGINATFTTEHPFVPETVEVELNGLTQKVIDDYNTSGDDTIIFLISPLPGDKILVDYSRASVGELVFGEVPSGAVNGINDTYTSANDFDPSSVEVKLNGLTQKVGDDYTITGNDTITFLVPPLTNDKLLINYQKL